VATKRIPGKRDNPAPRVKKGPDPRNTLNELTGTEWITFTRSWFIHNPPPRSASQIKHPAKFPEAMVEEFIRFFTKRGEQVLDPFSGVGSTVMAALETGRRGVGIELNEKYHSLALERMPAANHGALLINDDSSRILEIWHDRGLDMVDFIITSPPYWDMLAHSRGHVLSTHKKREALGLDTVYSRDLRDLGNITDYQSFLERLACIFRDVSGVLKKGRFLVIIIQNLRSPEGKMMPLAWDLAGLLGRFLVFKGEKIWCQDNKQLGIWGYPREFVSNIHHHYCLIFKKEK
jgi:DNA modification methylase